MVITYKTVPAESDMIMKSELQITAEITIEDHVLRTYRQVQKMTQIVKETVESMNKFEGKLTRKTQ
jgi:hypothetical protein